MKNHKGKNYTRVFRQTPDMKKGLKRMKKYVTNDCKTVVRLDTLRENLNVKHKDHNNET